MTSVFAQTSYASTNAASNGVNLMVVIALAIGAFTILAVVIGLSGLISSFKTNKNIKKELETLLHNGVFHSEQGQSKLLRKKGFTLRDRLMVMSLVPIIIIDIIVMVTFGFFMIQREDAMLAQGLKSRVEVILNSITNSAKIYLPMEDQDALSSSTSQIAILPEAEYVTICAYNSRHPENGVDYIWASSDKNILSKIDTDIFDPGKSRLVSNQLSYVFENFSGLNTQAAAQLTNLSQNLLDLEKESRLLSNKYDPVSRQRFEEIEVIHAQLYTRVENILENLSVRGIGSVPQYDASHIDRSNTEYVFYKPVLYYQSDSKSFVRGVVFVGVNTEALIGERQVLLETMIRTAVIIILVSILVSIIFAFIISAAIVRPINELVHHVALIRDTDDKERLAGKKLEVKRHDEIGVLGDTVNEMTDALVSAAVVSRNLNFGKEIQTRFIPLETDANGTSLTTGRLLTKGAEFFIYYAGADELSGDYFDYHKIGEHQYAIIKCDISGHGVPAALIMVEIATMFQGFFRSWNVNKDKQSTNLALVVEQMNDLLERRGFKGRFAAFTLCLLDTKTGECIFCNAGDNLVHLYDSATHRKHTITLAETPAAGMFSTDMINMKGGYRVSKLTLKKGDVLFLYTDGIVESKRYFRDARYNVVPCEEYGMEEGELHETHMVGDTSEEMTSARVNDIIEAVFARETYTLRRFHDPSHSFFTFDFSSCTGSAEDVIMALVSVEKVFRFYRLDYPKATDRVKVDKNIDLFLRKCFVQYDLWCADSHEIDNDSGYLYYRGILEDTQYDDLTLVAIKKD